MSVFTKMAEKIIEKQESIIGSIALDQAKRVEGLNIDWIKREVYIKGDEMKVIESLVEQYEKIFGKASIAACKEAVKSITSQVPQNQIPSLLR